MPVTNLIAAREFPGGEPATLQGFAKLRWSVKNPPQDPEVTFEGKTVLVTGANAGLGFEAAVKYAQKGASKLILAVRSSAKGDEAKQLILDRTGRENEKDFISVLTVDLSTFKSVKAFVSALEKETQRLDAVLLNAGLANPKFEKLSSGWEAGIQVNVLSTAYMALLLLPLLQKTASMETATPHLTFVNSIGHEEVKREWYAEKGSILEEANSETGYDTRKSYAMVKLLGMATMRQFAQMIVDSKEQPNIIVNACCPFLCRTNLGRSFSLPMRMIGGAMQYFTARTAEEGSRTLVGATALGPESHGRFWHHDFLYPGGELARDDEEMRKCWDDIAKALQAAQVDVDALIK